VRAVLRRVRYQKCRVPDRPNLSDPVSCCGLFRFEDMIVLAKVGCWPLPPSALARLREPPAARARRRKRRAERIVKVVTQILEDDRPASAREVLRILCGVQAAPGAAEALGRLVFLSRGEDGRQ
jgi:hypothetical protein